MMRSRKYIRFADPEVERVCIANFSSDGIGVTYEDAANVTDVQFGTTFQNNTLIETFEELELFTGLTTIPAGAFMGCTSLTRLVIPDNVTSVLSSAWYNAPLTHLTLGANLSFINQNLAALSTLTHLTVSSIAQFLTIENAFTWGNLLDENASTHIFVKDEGEVFDFVVPSGFTKVYNRSFIGLGYITSVTIPSSVTEFSAIFRFTPSIQSITINANITELSGSITFGGCANLNSVILPSTLKKISGIVGLFGGCTSLTSIAFPENLEEIINCTQLFSGSGVRTITSWGKLKVISGFSYANLTSTLQLPDTLETIQDQTFAYASIPSPIIIPENVTSIGSRAFKFGDSQKFILRPITPPALGTEAFFYPNIYVPYSADHSVLNDYKTASGWSDYASRIYELNPDGTIPNS